MTATGAAAALTSAPAKVILFGEHAVVYGEPAVAAAVDLRLRVRVARGPAGGPSTINDAPLASAYHHYLSEALKAAGEDKPVAFQVEASVPGGSGLGSSAALVSASLLGLLALAGKADRASPVPRETLARLAYDVEAAAQQGRASPTDTTTVTEGGAILVGRERGPGFLWEITRGERRWSLHKVEPPAMPVVIGFTHERGRTATEVAKVARFVARTGFAKDVIREIGDVAREGAKAAARGDRAQLGKLFDRNHNLLTILGVSTPRLNRLCEVARRHAHGAKLTGSGGGGSMIAVSDEPEACAAAIRKAGGAAWVATLGAQGVRFE
ncbi:MAG TPA: mevalonate kinase [Candidatus Thermoplasmatota archaeon]|nr:mevalonate kinase [Candidatus Thermoplasmatota archaeon]